MKMPFGKYVGKEISSLPVTYARWLYENVELDRWRIRKAVERRLGVKQTVHTGLEERAEKLEKENKELTDKLQEAMTRAWEQGELRQQLEEMRCKLKRAYRQLAMRFHPDRGGSHDDMKLINELLGEE